MLFRVGAYLLPFKIRMELLPEESGVDGQNDVVDRVTVSDQVTLIVFCRGYVCMVKDFVCRLKNKTEVKHGFISDSVV